MQCDVCGGVIYISNKSKYLKTDVRYATAIPIFIISNVLSNKRVFFKPNFSFYIPFKNKVFLLRIIHHLSKLPFTFFVCHLSKQTKQ